jgi:hypothetical protein
LNVVLDALDISDTRLRTSLKRLLYSSSKTSGSFRKGQTKLLSMLLEAVAKQATLDQAALLCLYTRAASRTTPILLTGYDMQNVRKAAESFEAIYLILFQVSKFLDQNGE